MTTDQVKLQSTATVYSTEVWKSVWPGLLLKVVCLFERMSYPQESQRQHQQGQKQEQPGKYSSKNNSNNGITLNGVVKNNIF